MRTMTCGLALSGLVLLSCCTVHPVPPGRVDERVVDVIVKDRDTHDLVARAKVMILREDGRIIAQSRTDEWGVARIPVLPASSKAKYVLVDADPYFLSGTRWMEGMREYWIEMSLFAVP